MIGFAVFLLVLVVIIGFHIYRKRSADAELQKLQDEMDRLYRARIEQMYFYLVVFPKMGLSERREEGDK